MFTNLWKMMRENKFESENEICSELKCRICKCLMIKACNAPCGCRFCSDCIEQYLSTDDKFCPGEAEYCQVQMINFTADVSGDNVANLRISKVIVKCPKQNCEIKTELIKMQEHMNNCDKRPISCPFNTFGCAINEVASDEMNAHLNESNYCHSNLLIAMINNLNSQMESLMNENMELRQRMGRMEAKEADNTVVSRSQIQLFRDEITVLSRENRQFKQQIDNIDSQSTNQQQKMCEMEAKELENARNMEETNKEMKALKNEYRSLRSEMETNTGAINQIRMQIEKVEINFQKQSDEFKQIYEHQQQLRVNKKLEIEKCDNDIRLIQTFGNEIFIKFGFFEWQIDKISQQKRKEWIYSKPFYSESSGYKMCLAINVRDYYIDDYIDIDFHLMRGKFDYKLEWPFKYTVTVDAVDSANRNLICSKSIKYSDYPYLAGWRKPSNDRNNPIRIFYYFGFISIKKAAVRNNNFLLKCNIEKL